MELRIDRLLADLRADPAALLASIDADPLLVHRASGDLVLSNASQALYTPVSQHQLYAKGIVYRRDPFRLVSMPLLKIYNVGEREVDYGALSRLLNEDGVRLRFYHKMDGSLVQVFEDGGRVYVTTRGMIEGNRDFAAFADAEDARDFDYLAESRALLRRRYPRLLDDPTLIRGKTLLFEIIHPQARVVTDYGAREDLVFLACFDRDAVRYLPHAELEALADALGLTLVESVSPASNDLSEQVASLMASLAGTDNEGFVLAFETDTQVVYRVKAKSPDYLALMRILAYCTYARTVEFLDSRPEITSWELLEAALREQGREKVPEEVLAYYREHYDAFAAYLADLDRVGAWARAEADALEASLGGRASLGPSFRKAFAARATAAKHPGLLFAALDGRLGREKLRKMFASPREAREIMALLGIES